MAAVFSCNASRRSFLRISGLAAGLPLLSEGHLAWAALPGRVAGAEASPSSPVMINANENPLGPSSGSLAAIASSARTVGDTMQPEKPAGSRRLPPSSLACRQNT